MRLTHFWPSHGRCWVHLLLYVVALYVYIIHTLKCIGVIQSQLTISVKSLEHVITSHYIFLRFQIQNRTIITLFETESIPNVLTKWQLKHFRYQYTISFWDIYSPLSTSIVGILDDIGCNQRFPNWINWNLQSHIAVTSPHVVNDDFSIKLNVHFVGISSCYLFSDGKHG